MYSDWNDGFSSGALFTAIIMGLFMVLIMKTSVDIAPEQMRIDCERELPRSEKCVWISVPESEVNKEDILSPPSTKE